MLNKHRLMAVAVALAFSAGTALAAVSPQEAAKLGDTLTPFAPRRPAIAAGNPPTCP